MSIGFPLSSFSSTYICLLLVGALFHSCFSTQNLDDVLCLDYERQALVEFKHGLIDEADRLNSWAIEEKDCCKWDGIFCDNFTGHVHQIHLRAVDGHCLGRDYNTATEFDEMFRWRLRGNISPSILNLKQLKHLDLSCNDFKGIRIPTFMGSIGNLRYLNLSHSRFGGSVPPQLGNLSELVILCLETYSKDPLVRTRMMNMQWLSSLYMLRHLDLSGVDLSKAVDWLQVINTLPNSLVQLHLSRSRLPYIRPQVASPNLTSLSLLNLSGNRFSDSSMFVWIFSITSLVSLDLSECGFQDPFPNSIYSFHNLTSLKFLHMSGNNLMNLSSVLKRLVTIASNLVYLDASDCDVSSSVLGSLHNLTSLLSLDLTSNMLDNTTPTSLGNLCNLRDLDLGYNHFSNISLERLLEGFFESELPRLKSLSLQSSGLSSHLPDKLGQLIHLVHLQMRENCITGIIPDSIGRLSFLRSLQLDKNLISGPIPFSIAELSSLEVLGISDNRVNGNIPVSLGLLSKLSTLDITNNLLTGTMTEAHFANLTGLKVLLG